MRFLGSAAIQGQRGRVAPILVRFSEMALFFYFLGHSADGLTLIELLDEQDFEADSAEAAIHMAESAMERLASPGPGDLLAILDSAEGYRIWQRWYEEPYRSLGC